MNLASLDLNLLRIFAVMTAELNTKRAGERLGISQPAVSSALGRLRLTLKDDLFVRVGNSMVPTPTAETLREPICEALRQLEEAVATGPVFRPESCRTNFRVGGGHYFRRLYFADIAKSLSQLAPEASVLMHNVIQSPALEKLKQGDLDVCLTSKSNLPDGVAGKLLFWETFVCLAASGREDLRRAGVRPGDRIPADIYTTFDHVICSRDGEKRGMFDQILEEHGFRRRIVETVLEFRDVARSVELNGYFGSVPARFSRYAETIYQVTAYELPFQSPKRTAALFWSKSKSNDPENTWFRNLVFRTIRKKNLLDDLSGSIHRPAEFETTIRI